MEAFGGTLKDKIERCIKNTGMYERKARETHCGIFIGTKGNSPPCSKGSRLSSDFLFELSVLSFLPELIIERQ